MWNDGSADGSSQARKPERRLLTADRRKRTSFTKEHLELLQVSFDVDPYPGISVKESLSQATGIPESRIQVWFRNKRARAMKNRSVRTTSPQSESASVPLSPFFPTQTIQRRDVNDGPAYSIPHCQPVSHSQMREDVSEMDCFFSSFSPPPAYTQGDAGYSSPSYGRPRQGRLLGTSSSPSCGLNASLRDAQGSWVFVADAVSPESMLCPPAHRVGNGYAAESNIFLYPSGGPPAPYPYHDVRPGSVGALDSVSSSPVSPDSACWDMGLDISSPPAQHSQYGELLWDVPAPEPPLAPLPDLSSQCLEDILVEMQPGWWYASEPLDLPLTSSSK